MNILKKSALLVLMGALALPALTQTAQADDGRRHDQRWHGDIHRFHARDLNYWHSGRWFHGPHGGRDSWWWTVGGNWYFYAHPVYPYPDPYTPPFVAAAGPVYYWYCRHPAGYYPYVPACAGRWHAITAIP